jgi:hypothetical protein
VQIWIAAAEARLFSPAQRVDPALCHPAGGLPMFFDASDYPHKVDLVAAKQMIHESVERTDLTHAQKAGVVGENAKRFFQL